MGEDKIIYECWVSRTDHRFAKIESQLDVSHWLNDVLSDGQLKAGDGIHIVAHLASEYHS